MIKQRWFPVLLGQVPESITDSNTYHQDDWWICSAEQTENRMFFLFRFECGRTHLWIKQGKDWTVRQVWSDSEINKLVKVG